ncbi:hypothetical protein HZH66_011824 [Vespula vulgaris]|uniref:Uncharacterized protein n=1 Tax=Vespula vulgaris TaxID=7454 RepID=A0A834MUM4_VESVU|nr:hypothetical protein HZH66_011824 [Vespula vulgaris]
MEARHATSSANLNSAKCFAVEGASTLPREDSPGIEEKEKEKEKFQVHRRRVRILRKRNDPLTRVKLPHSLSSEATVVFRSFGSQVHTHFFYLPLAP